MKFQSLTPAFPLNVWIKSIFYYEGLTPGHRLDRFLPNGDTEIIFSLSAAPQFIYDNDTLAPLQTCRLAWVSGVRTRPITIPSGQGSRMVVVAARKGRAFPFFPLPLSELTDAVAPAELVFGRSALELRDRLLEASSITQILALVESYLLRLAGDSLNPDQAARCIEFALSGMIRSPSATRLKRLSDQIGYSQKHFINLFKRRVGVSPKQYLRIIRFQAILERIENDAGPEPLWSRLAVENGYYDQAHLIHDFKHFSGFTPGEYLQRKSETLNYIPVA